MGHLFPHDRPFVNHIGYNFLHHAPDDSFPSDHGTVIFTFALAFIFWHRLWSGALFMAIAVAIALVAGVPRRTLAAGYAGWVPGRTNRLPERPDDLATIRHHAVFRVADLLSHLLRPADP